MGNIYSETDPTYWDNKGKHQEKSDILDKLVPPSGKSDHMRVEAVRTLGNLYHDLYNNGWCNQESSWRKYDVQFLRLHQEELVGTGEISEREFEQVFSAWEENLESLESYSAEYPDADTHNPCENEALVINLDKLADAVILWAWDGTESLRNALEAKSFDAESLRDAEKVI